MHSGLIEQLSDEIKSIMLENDKFRWRIMREEPPDYTKYNIILVRNADWKDTQEDTKISYIYNKEWYIMNYTENSYIRIDEPYYDFWRPNYHYTPSDNLIKRFNKGWATR